jgi:hypothetical protein
MSETIYCAVCEEFGSEDRENFEWGYGVPVCCHCVVERADDHELWTTLEGDHAVRQLGDEEPG